MAAKRSKSPRRRAKQARARATTDVILEAAARVLARSGYAAATTNRIAAVAGVSIGTLYQYFADKQEIFDALIHREIETVRALLASRPLDPSRSLEDDLVDLFRALIRAQPHGPALFRQLQHAPNALLRRRVGEANVEIQAFVEQLLEVHRAEVRVVDRALASFLLVNATEGVGLAASSELFGERLALELARLFGSYLRSYPGD